ncbi:16669_t:CDS:2 [Gigaspora margarita]|uniref:16669_t:CDS:1 n=1 Tax=Gigaspora margarita TaxID=4874 RepID=A0ABN7UKY6_GIGMA|nr:16669_t:CDS:2 [Gigaspora margarita]
MITVGYSFAIIQKKALLEKIEKLHRHASTEQLVKVLLNFTDSYEDFNNAKPCSQVLYIDISVFLNSFIDHIETSNENEYNKLIAYHIVKLVSKADGYETIEDNELSNVEYKVKELYSLMDCAKIIIDKHTQMPNAKQWINSIDKNFNSL